MATGFTLRFRRDGTDWAIERITGDGIVVDAETDAWPRQLVVELWPRSPVTEIRLRDVQRQAGWRETTFQMIARTVNGRVRFESLPAVNLPGGDYNLRVHVASVTTPGRPMAVRLKDNASTPVDINAGEDPRMIVVSAFAMFDPELKRVLEATGEIDGRPVDQWFPWVTPTAARKACLLNVLASLRVGPADPPLITFVERVILVDPDRIYAEVKRELIANLRALSDDAGQAFYQEGEPTSKTHERLLRRIDQLERRAAHQPITTETSEQVIARMKQRFDLTSFRADEQPSVQIVVAAPKNDPNGRHYADLDIDLGNPLRDLEGLVVHIGEVASSEITNHLDLRDKLSAEVIDILPWTLA